MMPSRASILLILVVAGCAQVRDPSGGERDTAPPQLLSAEPPSGTTGFRGDRIVLRFDERIKLGGADKVLVSPPLAAKPTVRMMGSNAVVVDLQAPLEPNTTYVFNIGDAVSDLTEGNTAGLLYVISTGDHLDSLYVQGEVLNAATGRPEKDVLVMLYDATNDTGFHAGRPSYYTRTLENGVFALSYLRAGSYSIRALRDQNGNYRYDLPNEEVAFLADPVDAHANDTLGHVLHLFREAARQQALINARALPDGALRLVFARPVGALELEPVEWSGGKLKWYLEPGASRDTVLCWPSDTTLMQGRMFRVVADSLALDTVQYQRREKMPYTLDVRMIEADPQDEGGRTLRTSRPVERIDDARIFLEPASPGKDALMMKVDTVDRRTIQVMLPEQGAGDQRLVLLPKALQDFYGGVNDTVRISLAGPAPEELGQLTITLSGEGAGPGILQLMTQQDQVLREFPVDRSPATIGPVFLLPGNYAFRLVEDRNGNGRWDTGDLANGLLPEGVQRCRDAVTVRAGWELSTSWEVVPR